MTQWYMPVIPLRGTEAEGYKFKVSLNGKIRQEGGERRKKKKQNINPHDELTC